MADIRNLISEGETNASSADYSIMRKAGDESLGTALSGLGDLIKGTAQVADDWIQGNIQGDIFKTKDEVENQMGLGSSSLQESSGLPLSTPDEISRGFNNMESFKQAVAQGKLPPELYELRAHSLTKQLRSKYPGYREIIDQKIQSTFGIDPANSVRSKLLKDIEAGNEEDKKLRAEDFSLISDVTKNYGWHPAIQQADEEIRRGPLSPDTRKIIRRLQADQGNLQRQKMINEAQDLGIKQTTRKATNYFSTRVHQIIGEMSNPFGDGSVETLFMSGQLDNLSPEQQIQAQQVILNARQVAVGELQSLYSRELYDPQTGEVSGTMTKYLPEMQEMIKKIDDQLSVYNQRLSGKPEGIAAMDLNSVRISQIKQSEELGFLRDERFTSPRAYQMMYGKDWLLLYPDKNKLKADMKTVVPALIGALGTSGLSHHEVITAYKNTSGIPSGAAVHAAYSDVNGEKFAAMPPESKLKWVKGLVAGDGNVLKPLNRGDRLRMYKMLMSPEISSYVSKSAPPEVQERFMKFHADSFQLTFMDDIKEISAITKEDMIGWQMKFDPKSGFSLEPENGWSSVGSFANLGQANQSMLRVNSFMRSFQASLPEGMPEEQKAALTAQVLEGAGVLTNPDANGGFWYKAYEGVKGYLSGDKTSEAGGVKISPAGYSPVDDIADALDRYESGGNYDATLGFSQNKFGVDPTEMTVSEVLNFQRSPEYREWSKEWKRKNNVGNPKLPSTPVGRYQIVGDTLKWLIDEMGLTGDEVFDKSMQDKMFVTLLKRRGLDEYLSGQIDAKQFIRRAKGEWAGLKSERAQREFLTAVDRVKDTMNKGES